MVLSDKEIKKLVIGGSIIDKFDENNLQAVSYDFTSSNIICIFRKYHGCIDLKLLHDTAGLSEEYDMSEGYELMPGEYVLVKVKERVSLPDNIAGHVRPRTTFTKLGLVLAPQHINPSFSGYLFVGLRNATQNTIKIYPELIIGQFVFEKISGEVSPEKLYKNKANAKYQNEDKYIAPRLREELSPQLQIKYDELMRDLAGGK